VHQAVEQSPANGSPRLWRWLDERLGLGVFHRKYGRKAFPVHSTFFFGEMAAFCFVILVATGIYLGLIYIPSNAEITVEGETLPEAYASVHLIESIPVANLFRNVHHWAAHVMVASVLLHLLRVYFTGTYRKPREINWLVGVALLGLTLMAGFVGYALPYDSYAMTATGIGFAIARSIPWVGPVAAELFFGGAFPTLGSIPRLYTIHVFIVPALLALLIGFHLLVVVKQKHTQPGYAKRIAEPDRILGVPLWPYQALLAGQLLLLMFGVLFLIAAVIPPHPLAAFGPPGPATPEVKPDWYLLWIYGFLKIIPAGATINLPGATIGPNFLGGILFPALIFTLLTIAPWLDRTNRRVLRRFEYQAPPRQSPVRFGVGIGLLALLGTLFLAAFYDELGMSLGQIWLIVLVVPVVLGALTAFWTARTAPAERFDPTSADTPTIRSPIVDPTVLSPGLVTVAAAGTPGDGASGDGASGDGVPVPLRERQADRPGRPGPTLAPAPVASVDPTTDLSRTLTARGDRARAALVAALQEGADLAPAVEQLDGADLLELLDYIDSLRLGLAESSQVLQGVVRGHEVTRTD
jgi:cytochrome b-561